MAVFVGYYPASSDFYEPPDGVPYVSVYKECGGDWIDRTLCQFAWHSFPEGELECYTEGDCCPIEGNEDHRVYSLDGSSWVGATYYRSLRLNAAPPEFMSWDWLFEGGTLYERIWGTCVLERDAQSIKPVWVPHGVDLRLAVAWDEHLKSVRIERRVYEEGRAAGRWR